MENHIVKMKGEIKMREHCKCHGRCHCGREKTIVHPTKKNVKNVYTEETINHVYPSHTTVVNNHLVRNVFSYTHSTSYETRVREIDERNNRVGGAGDRGNGDFSDPSNVRGVQDRGGSCGSWGGCGRCSRNNCSCNKRGFWF